MTYLDRLVLERCTAAYDAREEENYNPIPMEEYVGSRRDQEKFKRGHKELNKTCAECGKKFRVHLGRTADYRYHEQYKGKACWFCSWTCMSINRKKRKKK